MKYLLIILLLCLPLHASIYYVNPYGGSDAASGADFQANARKTITHPYSPGDILRVAKTKDSTDVGVTALWTTMSKTVTLSSQVTSNIYLCEGNFTASVGVASANTTAPRKEGAQAVQITITNATFVAGLAAFRAITSTDLSAYTQISLWFRSSTVQASNIFSIKLCSDVAGLIAVNTIVIPEVKIASVFMPVTINTGGALGSAIQSVALYSESPGANTIVVLDDIIACLDPAATNSVSLNSLIGKKTSAEPEWYPIGSINGTTVLVDNNVANITPTTGRGYSGVTETVQLWKRETVANTNGTGTTTINWLVMTNSIQILGGWNTNTIAVDGTTWLDGQNGQSRGIDWNGKTNVQLSDVGLARFDIGLYMAAAPNHDATFTNVFVTASTGIGASIATGDRLLSSNLCGYNNGNNAISFTTGARHVHNRFRFNNSLTGAGASLNSLHNSSFIGGQLNNNLTAGSLQTSSDFVQYYGSQFIGNTTYAIQVNSGTDAELWNCLSTNNATGSINLGASSVGRNFWMFNTAIYESTEFTWLNTSAAYLLPMQVFSDNHDQTPTNSFTKGRFFTSQQDTATVNTAGGASWKVTPTENVLVSNLNPVEIPLGPLLVMSNVSQTISIWTRFNNATITNRLILPAYTVAGIITNVVATATGASNTWSKIEITFTPLETRTVTPFFQCWGGSTNIAWFDDLVHSSGGNPGTNYTLDYGLRGRPAMILSNVVAGAGGGTGSYTITGP